MKSFVIVPMAVCGALVLFVASLPSLAYAQSEARFGTRSPLPCPRITTQPTPAQVPVLVQCGYERTSHDYIYLMQDIRTEVGGTRPFNSFADGYATDIDASANVLPIRGSMSVYTCGAISDMGISNRGKNCVVERSSDAKGGCWRTTLKTWTCSMGQAMAGKKEYEQAPPR